MSNIPIPLSKSSMADWISDFVNSLNKNKVEETAEIVSETEEIVAEAETTLEKSAEINIKDLPKVVWNDETFYVLFDGDSGKATILNEFTNIVTTIDAKSIEEVDELLNSKQVVAEKDEVFECELEKNLDTDLLSKIAELEEQVRTLTNEVMELREQQYARNQEHENLDINAVEQEVQHFNETSQQTQESINNDNNVDITTPEGRTELSLKEKLLNELNQMDDSSELIEYNEEEIELEDENLDIKTETDETNVNEVEIDEIESLENKQTEEFDDVEVIEEQNSEIDTKIEDTKLDDFSNEEEINTEEEVNEEEEIKILSSRDSKIFKNAICPVCGDQLVKANKVGSFQGIICNGECKSEFAINLDTEQIFKK